MIQKNCSRTACDPSFPWFDGSVVVPDPFRKWLVAVHDLHGNKNPGFWVVAENLLGKLLGDDRVCGDCEISGFAKFEPIFPGVASQMRGGAGIDNARG